MLKFDRANAKVLQSEVIAALEAVAQKHGLTVRTAGGSIGDVKLLLKLEFNVADKGTADAAERKEFDLYCAMFGLTPEHYKARFTSRGDSYELTGFMPRRPKFPLKAKRVSDGHVVLFTSDIVARLAVVN